MANTYVQQRIHLVWSTHKREPVLSAEHLHSLPEIIGGIIRRTQGVLFVAGGTQDHVHVYAEYPTTLSLSKFVNEAKSYSSKWLREKPGMATFHWQSGYGGFSVSRRGDQALQEYIINQAERHKTMTFQEEYLRLLKQFGIPYDPRYVFD